METSGKTLHVILRAYPKPPWVAIACQDSVVTRAGSKEFGAVASAPQGCRDRRARRRASHLPADSRYIKFSARDAGAPDCVQSGDRKHHRVRVHIRRAAKGVLPIKSTSTAIRMRSGFEVCRIYEKPASRRSGRPSRNTEAVAEDWHSNRPALRPIFGFEEPRSSTVEIWC